MDIKEKRKQISFSLQKQFLTKQYGNTRGVIEKCVFPNFDKVN